VLESGWIQDEPYLIFDIKAQAFLYHMVRRLVFIQVSIAQGKLQTSALTSALDLASGASEMRNASLKGGQKFVHGLAPAKGLILAQVGYPADVTDVSEDNIAITKTINRQLDPSR
jgi:tRNA pseudouridine38-40 synthase